MSAVRSSLTRDQEKKLLSLFGHVRLHLLYKASIHGYTAVAFHQRCNIQGATLTVAYNQAGFIFGGYTSKDYTQSGANISDDKAFLYSLSSKGDKPLRVASNDGKHGFVDGGAGPNFGALVFLLNGTAIIQSYPGTGFTFKPEEMHGNDLVLTELEVYRVEDLGGLRAKPWRNIQWTDERKRLLMEKIQHYKPEIRGVSAARVLLVGPVGAGKSSFFNSVNSAFRGNMTSQAICGVAGRSVTTQLRTFHIKVGKGGKSLPLVLCDTMGLEDSSESGLDMEDLMSVYKGHVQDRYQFRPSEPLQPNSHGYNKNATLKDMIHCVVFVIDTCKASVLSDKMLEKISATRRKAIQLGIPQLLLMTKVDEACPLVAEDLRNLYLSEYIQRKARELSSTLGIPLCCVLPVKNYSQELDLDVNVDILLMSAVDQMLNYTDSFFENQVVEEQDMELYRSADFLPPNLSRPESKPVC